MTALLAPSSRAVLDLVADLRPVTLSDLQSNAALQERIDTKFILNPSTLRALLGSMEPALHVLEIDGYRQFDYESVYFDSPGWRTYRDHIQGRRRRFKARTRHYVGSGLCMFEVKVEGRSGETIKHRQPHPVEAVTELTSEARVRLDQLLLRSGISAAPDLRPAVRTRYRRTTLTSPTGGLRLTIDTDLHCDSARGSTSALQDRVLVEVKTSTHRHPVLTAFASAGVRPLSVSKYCVGVALLHPELPRSPWAEVLRNHFSSRPLDRRTDRATPR